MVAPLEKLCEMMGAFLSGEDRTLAMAGRIEVALEDLMGDEEPYASVVLALASYRPGGGEFLYNEAEIIPFVRVAFDAIACRGGCGGVP